jgi:hypothetical protein
VLESCKSVDDNLIDRATDRCVLKAFSERGKNSDVPNLPCGPDCYWDVGDVCGGNGRCIGYGGMFPLSLFYLSFLSNTISFFLFQTMIVLFSNFSLLHFFLIFPFSLFFFFFFCFHFSFYAMKGCELLIVSL